MDTLATGNTLRDQLLADRKNLLDLGTRNRLIHLPLRSKNNRIVEIVDEKSVEVCRMLSEGRGMTFLPGVKLTEEEKKELGLDGDDMVGGIPQPDDQDLDEKGIARRHTDSRLQTRLTSEGLQKRLFDIWYDSRTLEEEQGVNILYLAIGLLRWFEDDKSDVERNAPLILLPVKLERTSASERFTLKGRGEAPSTNLSLQEKLNGEFGIKLPDLPEDDDLNVEKYLQVVSEAISAKSRWNVMADAIVLGFFSFSKFLMYRDLDPENWPSGDKLDEHPVVAGLLRDGFPYRDPIVPETGRIDEEITPERISHVVDADSSQSIVIEEATRGHHLVVKGPPGTGKSQTITNIIASAAAEGRRVLFVAEKMAALEVVHRRLRDSGLGALAFELHSNKANKKGVLEELRKTKELVTRQPKSDATVIERLKDIQATLNGHADLMHIRQDPSGLTPFALIGHLMRTRDQGIEGSNLKDPHTWTPADFLKRVDCCDELADRLRTIGAPPYHPWYGVQRDALMPEDIDRLSKDVGALHDELGALMEACETTRAILELKSPSTLDDIGLLMKISEAAVTFPGDRSKMINANWDDPATVAELVNEGQKLREMVGKIDATFSESAWDANLAETRSAIAAHGASLFRFLNGGYRSQLSVLRSYMKADLPKGQKARLDAIDLLMAGQKRRKAIAAHSELGKSVFGNDWIGEASDWSKLSRIVSWDMQYRPVLDAESRTRIAKVSDIAVLKDSLLALDVHCREVVRQWGELVQFIDLNELHAIGSNELARTPLEAIRAKVDAWHANVESITKWISFVDRCRHASSLGLQEIVVATTAGRLDAASLRPSMERAYYQAIRNAFFEKMPELKRFDGDLHSRTVGKFRELEAARVSLTREKIVTRHAEELPRGNAGIGPLGVLNAELAKKKNHLPIRMLLERAGPAIQQIKPIFMMSPLSVAQFLKPGAVAFDLLVIDEASQVEPVDALGAIARAKQVVIVGDERQLPPTRFFAKLTTDINEADEDAEDVTLRARDAESILDLCLAKGMPDRMLRWHYRSKHQSLIAVSNREFYDNRLFIVPSPYDAIAGMGLRFNYLPNAHYDRGNTRTNPIEARTVAEAVIAHARSNPGQSLGVATFSVAQRQAVLKELELLRRQNPDVEDFFNKASTEPFFVKNLENIQGDERDVIFISVGYGRTQQGYMSMSFGPLNSDGGERRLNVLISRAKLRCEVFSSITGDDIDLERVRSRGVVAFKLFLTFAQTGKFGIAEATGNDADSVFEEQVGDRLRSLGYDVKNQIGSAGFFVDLAISDAEKPGRFVLGIECDGYQYHSSRSARDRDRLRQNVLESHGWIIHRIWSTDWYLRPQDELNKVVAAIESAKGEWRARDEDLARPKQAVPLHFTVEEQDDVTLVTAHAAPERKPISVPYEEAKIAVRRDCEPHEVSVGEMARYVTSVVAAECPIHNSEVVVRIRSAWGLARAGNRIRDAVEAGLSAAVRSGSIAGNDGFYTVANKEIVIRDRSDASLSVRRPEALPPTEIAAAAIAVLKENFGASKDQLVLAVARIFGFLSTSSQLRSVLELAIDDAVAAGQIVERDGMFVAN
ncbi:DUF3320 domain-containing protein (plasmid) [Rhizobium sp. CB3171]|uniref:DUF3320 domain-containing protein n=1 Tax=Rhizobium sp. CB3171 TaxID=3039157 RepID=UPI0024B227D5|nr:DUF3320 domain-containing protein [Rhizobium sp. CB3171]WFU04526.1 DUF3320 domain-containing protein [Rhizobium sp. CB3171]